MATQLDNCPAGKSPRMLVVDDDADLVDFLCAALEPRGLEVRGISDARQCLSAVKTFRPGIVLLDVSMPHLDGLQLLEQILDLDPGIDVILMTGYYSTESAVHAIQKGAYDYWPKPLTIADIFPKIDKWKQEADVRARAYSLDEELLETFQFEGLVGRSPAMLEVFSRLRRVAPHFQTVLLTGETGTGKELAARALHRLSPYAAGPFLACNCAAIAESLFEEEVFGHLKGTFTGADRDRKGLIERASGGVIFFDEIGELPLNMQSKLLRFLQDSEVRPVGGDAHRVDVRVVAATNQDLRRMVAEKKFREDLYYRLAVVQIRMPRLVERREDLPLLQRHFLRIFAAKYNKSRLNITRRAQAFMARYSWPGNVRELENLLGYCAMMAEGEIIDVQHFPPEMLESARNGKPAEDELISIEELARRHANRVLRRVGGNRTQAAEILGVSRSTLYRLLKQPEAGPEDGKSPRRVRDLLHEDVLWPIQ